MTDEELNYNERSEKKDRTMSDGMKNLMELHLAEYSRRVGHITQPLLMSRIEELEAKLAKAVELLEEIEVRLAPISGFFFDTFPRKEIKAALAEIK